MKIWLATLICLVVAAPATAACRLALALALDVSGSVDEKEYVLQMNGMAKALEDPDVQDALFSMPDVPVALAIFEWSSSTYQRLILDWKILNQPQDAADVVGILRQWSRAPAPEATGLGAALIYSRELLARAPVCWTQTVDVSADGKNNDWPLPARLRKEGKLGLMTVNALVVAEEFSSTLDRTPNGTAELTAYFQQQIIQGPDAFVEVALGYEDYATAMRRKLLRELATRPLGRRPGVPAPPSRYSESGRSSTAQAG